MRYNSNEAFSEKINFTEYSKYFGKKENPNFHLIKQKKS